MQYKKVSRETKERICQLLDNDMRSRLDLTNIYQIPYTTVCKIYQDWCKNGGALPQPKERGRKRKLLDDEDRRFIKAKIDEECTRTLDELRTLLELERNKTASLETIRKAIDEFNYSVKRVEVIPQAAETEAIWEKRVAYAQWFLQANYHSGRLIFLDETGFKVSMRRNRGRSERGHAARLVVQRTKTKNITCIAGISVNRIEHYKILDGNGNAERFVEYLNELFTKLPGPGYTLIMDNARFHHSEIVRAAVQNAGHEIKYLPAYSPYFNPIEFLFSQWKGFVAGARPRNENELFAAINSVDQRVTVDHLKNYFRHVNTNCVSCVGGARVFDH